MAERLKDIAPQDICVIYIALLTVVVILLRYVLVYGCTKLHLVDAFLTSTMLPCVQRLIQRISKQDAQHKQLNKLTEPGSYRGPPSAHY